MGFKGHKTRTSAQVEVSHRREKAGGETYCHRGFKDTEEAAKGDRHEKSGPWK